MYYIYTIFLFSILIIIFVKIMNKCVWFFFFISKKKIDFYLNSKLITCQMTHNLYLKGQLEYQKIQIHLEILSGLFFMHPLLLQYHCCCCYRVMCNMMFYFFQWYLPFGLFWITTDNFIRSKIVVCGRPDCSQ